MPVKKLCVLSLGDAGVPLSAVIAYKCPEIRVTVVKANSEIIYQWNTASIPPSVYVPGIEDLLRKCHNKNLFFTTNECLTIKEAEIVFIVSDSKMKPCAEGGDRVVNLSGIEKTARLIADHSESSKIIVESSSVPLKAAECVKNVLKFHGKPEVDFQVLSNPEFYMSGSALKNLLNPRYILIGHDNTPLGLAAAKELYSIYQRWVESDNIIMMSTWSAELSKVCMSAFALQTVASLYAISCVFEKTGGVFSSILNALPDSCGKELKELEENFNIGKLRNELQSIVYLCDWHNLKEVGDYWSEVLVFFNSYRQEFIDKILYTIHENTEKKVAIFGFAYFKDTQVSEDSLAVDLCKIFLEQNAEISVYDPRMQVQKVVDDLISAGCTKSEESLTKSIAVHDDPYEAARDCQILVILATWINHSELDYEKIYDVMMKPAYVFDYNRGINYRKLSSIGFVNALNTGKPTKRFLH